MPPLSKGRYVVRVHHSPCPWPLVPVPGSMSLALCPWSLVPGPCLWSRVPGPWSFVVVGKFGSICRANKTEGGHHSIAARIRLTCWAPKNESGHHKASAKLDPFFGPKEDEGGHYNASARIDISPEGIPDDKQNCFGAPGGYIGRYTGEMRGKCRQSY